MKSEKRNERQNAKEPDAPMEQTIQERAYELYLERGQQPGHELEDWLQAEREIREQHELQNA